VTINVRESNDPPTVSVVSVTGTEDTSKVILGSSLLVGATPGPADEQAWQSVRLVRVDTSSARGGTVSWNQLTGNVVYTPANDFAGDDTFVFDVIDFSTDINRPLTDPRTTSGTVTITVANTNDAPFIKTAFGTKTLLEDQPAEVIDLSKVFDDVDILTANDQLTYSIVSNTPSGIVVPSVTNNNLTLQMVENQNGTATVVVRARDRAGATVVGTLTVNVTPVNDPPVVVSGLPDLSANKNTAISSIQLFPTHFSDPDIADGDVLTFRVVSNSNPLLVTPSIGGTQLNMNLVANQFGTAIITVSATDSAGQTVADEFTLTVNNVNEAPVGKVEEYRVSQGTLLNVGVDSGVLANDKDPEGTTLQAVLVSGPSRATQFTLNPNGSFTYLHNGVSRQTDTFVYRATDGQLQSSNITVTITIDPPPPPSHQNPTWNLDVNADGMVTPIDALLVINLLNDPQSPRTVGLLPPPPFYYDVTGDGIITANDALQVINHLNSRSRGGGPEGEAGLGRGAEGEAASYFAPTIVDASRTTDNRSVRMHDAVVYGPLLPEGEATDQSMGPADLSQYIDLSWTERCASHSTVTDEDLALSQLLEDEQLL
jgi:hypothetical protein